MDSIERLKGVGPKLVGRFGALGIKTVNDLATYWPRRYDDYSQVMQIAELRPGPVTISARIVSVRGRYVRRGMHITEAIAEDATGKIKMVWFNQSYRAGSIKSGATYYISGEYKLSNRSFSILNPSIELESEFTLNTARIIPIYRETSGIKSRQIRAAIAQIMEYIDTMPEILPEWLIQSVGLMRLSDAVKAIHFPEDARQLAEARRRLGFDEVFELVLASLLNRRENARDISIPIKFQAKLAQKFVAELPFDLTDDQRKVVWQIYQDMQSETPMNRMVEGDVGSGKTVVATMAALMVMSAKKQVALMAPTELLARQHYDTIQKLLKPLGVEDTVELLTGSMKPADKKAAKEIIASGAKQFIIGTHALITETTAIPELALVIVDEQHRFGVDQRKSLMAKADGKMPHVLTLTATPIPRSLALTLYGELDVSIIATKPALRKPIITQLVSPNSRAQATNKIIEELKAGRQVFVVCPTITDSELEDGKKLKSVESVYDDLSKKDFKDYRVGLLHGKLKPADKQAIMEQFVRHELDLIVSTTVIEVGVDVPNASVMVVENPERFGLAQIHQLRGRVGRGQDQGYCYLMLSDSKAPSKRLRALASTTDGFRLAEFDLEERGPGAIYGRMQHGALDLRLAQLSDIQLIASAREAAHELLDKEENLLQYKQLMEHVTRLRSVTNLN